MDNLKQMTLTCGDNYDFDDDCAKVMENLKQHLYNKLKGCKSVLGDLALDLEAMMREVAMMADCLDDDDLEIINHYRCLAGTCLRIAVYAEIGQVLDSETPNE